MYVCIHTHAILIFFHSSFFKKIYDKIIHEFFSCENVWTWGTLLNVSPMPQAHTLISSQCDFFRVVVDWRTGVKRASFPDHQLCPAAFRQSVP